MTNNTHDTVPTTRRRGRRGTALGALLVATLFLAGHTPGDIGGCGGDLSTQTLPGNPDEAQYDFFDQGLCANLCFRLRACGVLCESIRGGSAGCDNDSTDAYQQCVRGQIRPEIFGSDACPHNCTAYGRDLRFIGATQQDVQVCGHVLSTMSCNGLVDAIRNPPAECTAVCQ